MPDLADLFPGFSAKTVTTDAGGIFARIGGSGPPLALVHGFPETMAMWHRLAPRLAERFTVVAMDLRGYGWSAAPRSHGGERYTKTRMGADIVAVMEAIGFARFALAGHDRGARAGYRLALEQPGRLSALALLDIIPTAEQWRRMEADASLAPHWRFLAQPEPGPEQEIAKGPDRYFEGLMGQWAGDGSLSCFDPSALQHYRAAWSDPSRIHAMCEDYRAGAAQDRAADEADLAAGTSILCPTLIVTSRDYLGKSATEPAMDVWRRTFAPEATGTVVPGGHFVAEQAPDEVLAALMRFLDANVPREDA